MAAILKQKPRVAGQLWGDLSKPVTTVDEEWINARPVSNGLNFDAMSGALGAFELQVAFAGSLLSIGSGEFQVSIEEIGIYVKEIGRASCREREEDARGPGTEIKK